MLMDTITRCVRTGTDQRHMDQPDTNRRIGGVSFGINYCWWRTACGPTHHADHQPDGVSDLMEGFYERVILYENWNMILEEEFITVESACNLSEAWFKDVSYGYSIDEDDHINVSVTVNNSGNGTEMLACRRGRRVARGRRWSAGRPGIHTKTWSYDISDLANNSEVCITMSFSHAAEAARGPRC